MVSVDSRCRIDRLPPTSTIAMNVRFDEYLMSVMQWSCLYIFQTCKSGYDKKWTSPRLNPLQQPKSLWLFGECSICQFQLAAARKLTKWYFPQMDPRQSFESHPRIYRETYNDHLEPYFFWISKFAIRFWCAIHWWLRPRQVPIHRPSDWMQAIWCDQVWRLRWFFCDCT